MALYTELPVYRDTYLLTLKVFEVTKDFPREYKYTLNQDMKRDALHLLQRIIGGWAGPYVYAFTLVFIFYNRCLTSLTV